MKKLLFFAAIAVFSLTSINAQEKTTKSDVNKATDAVAKEATKLYDQAKTGGFKVGANIGIPLGGAKDVSKFNFGADIAWLWEIADNFEVGGLTGFTYFTGDGSSIEPYDYKVAAAKSSGHGDYESAGFIPIAATARYYFSDRKMFAGLDLGYAINVSGDADGGFYFRPKFGYNLGKVNLIGSFQKISGNINYPGTSVKIDGNSGYGSLNFGVEFAF